MCVVCSIFVGVSLPQIIRSEQQTFAKRRIGVGVTWGVGIVWMLDMEKER